MKSRLLVIAAACLALVGCQASALDKVSPANPVSLSEVDIAAIDAGVRASLKDPWSAVITGLKGAMESSSGVTNACGYVNAKNSFGGYTGPMPFHGTLATNQAGKRVFVVTGMGDGGTGSQVIFMMCQKQSMPL